MIPKCVHGLHRCNSGPGLCPQVFQEVETVSSIDTDEAATSCASLSSEQKQLLHKRLLQAAQNLYDAMLLLKTEH